MAYLFFVFCVCVFVAQIIAFLAFARGEFNSEGVLFWRRINDFKDSLVLTATPSLPATAIRSSNSSTDVLPIPLPTPTVTPANNNSNTTASTRDTTPLSSPSPNPPAVSSSLLSAGTGSLLVSSPKGGRPATRIAQVIPRTPAQAQEALLKSLVEASTIYAFYLDIGSPNELLIEVNMRQNLRSSLDSLLMRAAIAGNLISASPAKHMAQQSQSQQASSLESQHQLQRTPSPLPTMGPLSASYHHPQRRGDHNDGTTTSNMVSDMLALKSAAASHHHTNHNYRGSGGMATMHNNSIPAAIPGMISTMAPGHRMITRHGVSISAQISIDEMNSIEMEARELYTGVQFAVVQRLEAHSWARFRASDAFHALLASFKNHPNADGRSTHTRATPLSTPQRRIINGNQATGGSIADDVDMNNTAALTGAIIDYNELKGAQRTNMAPGVIIAGGKSRGAVAPLSPSAPFYTMPNSSPSSQGGSRTLAPPIGGATPPVKLNVISPRGTGSAFDPRAASSALAFGPSRVQSRGGGETPSTTGITTPIPNQQQLPIDTPAGGNGTQSVVQSLFTPSTANNELNLGGRHLIEHHLAGRYSMMVPMSPPQQSQSMASMHGFDRYASASSPNGPMSPNLGVPAYPRHASSAGSTGAYGGSPDPHTSSVSPATAAVHALTQHHHNHQASPSPVLVITVPNAPANGSRR